MNSQTMANDLQVSIRINPAVAERAEALVSALSRLSTYQAFRMERATVFKIALLRGLEELEREHGAAKERSKPSSKRHARAAGTSNAAEQSTDDGEEEKP